MTASNLIEIGIKRPKIEMLALTWIYSHWVDPSKVNLPQVWVTLADFGYHVGLLNYLAFQSIDFKPTR